MKEETKYCSLKKHNDIPASSYCQECKIYMCEKCENFHSELFTNHHQFKIKEEENIKEIFTGLCQINNHSIELEYYCKTHNILCCSKCISKIQDKGNGEHRDCDICFIDDFENEKKTKLDENINNLEKSLVTLEQSINEIKNIKEKINVTKEELKINIQKIFTKIRNSLNEREEQLFSEIDKIYNFSKSVINDDKIQKIEKLPKKTQKLIKDIKLKAKDFNWRNNNISSLVNECINIEKNLFQVNEIIELRETLKKYDPLMLFYSYEFKQEEEEFNELINNIKKFGYLQKKQKENTEETEEPIFDSNMNINEKEVKEWLDNKNFITKVLYRKSRDGSKPQNFHEKCDNKGITITFIQVDNNNTFGGYTEEGWEGSGPKKDEESFIFNSNGKYPSKKGKNSIYCNPKWGPTFGTSSYFEIFFDETLDKGETFGGEFENYSYFNNRKSTYDDIKWEAKELEVFKIIYI